MGQAIRIGRLIGMIESEEEETAKKISKILAKIETGITDRERVELAIGLALLNKSSEDNYSESLPEKEIVDFVAGIQRAA